MELIAIPIHAAKLRGRVALEPIAQVKPQRLALILEVYSVRTLTAIRLRAAPIARL